MTTKTTSTGCGCSGGGARAGCSCGSCAQCQESVGGFLRPRFFAGQLLTEDDLQQLVDYVVGKRRLHNRTVLGDGVVCGLEVHCDPCDRHGIVVRPGHAIDCCGNDIVVPCEHTLDINQLVRELRARFGRDCGEPCDEDARIEPPADTGDTGDTGAKGEMTGLRPRDDTEQPALKPAQRYYLYVTYCETDVDPVMPYTTDEPCGVSACQPTRVREGYRFELRCEAGDRDELDILDRLCACLCEPDKLADNSDRLREAELVAGKLQLHLASLAQPAAAAAAPDTSTPLTLAYALPASIDWDESVHAARLSDDEKALADALPTETNGDVTWTEERVVKAARALNAVGAALGRFALSQVRARTGREDTRIKRALAGAAKLEAADVFTRAREVITPELIAAHVASPVVRAELLSGREFADDIQLSGDDAPVTFEKLTTTRGLLYVSGTAISGAALSMYGQALLRIEQCLQSWLLKSPTCAARDLIERLHLPDDITSTTLTTSRLRSFVSAQARVSTALRKVVYECVCAALNPPCRPCDDPSVLLASVDVRECEVAHVCGVVRKWVLTGPNVRYWFPDLGEIGGALEEICCTGSGCDQRSDVDARQAILAAAQAVQYGPLALLLQAIGKRGDWRDKDRDNCARALLALVDADKQLVTPWRFGRISVGGES